LVLLAAACCPDPPPPWDTGAPAAPDTGPLDRDGDGWTVAQGDCDDGDPAVHPEAYEAWCDGVDANCDGASDYDGDGFDSEDYGGEDCDDADVAIHPQAAELAGNGVDDDCDGAIDSPLDSSALIAITGEQASSRAGVAIAGAGDVDGDGQADLLVGAQQVGEGVQNGAAYLLLGPLTASTSLAAAPTRLRGMDGSLAGSSLAGLGDMDGDGLDDFAVGAYLVLDPPPGESSLAAAHAKLLAESSGAYAGGALAGGGDVNGDGLSDLLIGAEDEGSAGQGGGAAYVVLGRVTGSLGLSAADAQLLAESPSDKAGCAVDFAGDVGGDDLEAILVGAWYEETGGTGAGAAYLVVLGDEY